MWLPCQVEVNKVAREMGENQGEACRTLPMLPGTPSLAVVILPSLPTLPTSEGKFSSEHFIV